MKDHTPLYSDSELDAIEESLSKVYADPEATTYRPDVDPVAIRMTLAAAVPGFVDIGHDIMRVCAHRQWNHEEEGWELLQLGARGFVLLEPIDGDEKFLALAAEPAASLEEAIGRIHRHALADAGIPLSHTLSEFVEVPVSNPRPLSVSAEPPPPVPFNRHDVPDEVKRLLAAARDHLKLDATELFVLGVTHGQDWKALADDLCEMAFVRTHFADGREAHRHIAQATDALGVMLRRREATAGAAAANVEEEPAEQEGVRM